MYFVMFARRTGIGWSTHTYEAYGALEDAKADCKRRREENGTKCFVASSVAARAIFGGYGGCAIDLGDVLDEPFWQKNLETRSIQEIEQYNDHDVLQELGVAAPPQCSVMDTKGNHCPRFVVYTFDDFHLCEQCYKNVKKGAYGRRLQRKVS